MKQFSIRKSSKPLAGKNKGPGAGDDLHTEEERSQSGSPVLTKQERAALGLEELKVTNPWIHEQTHQEYLENVKVSCVY